MLLGSGDLLIIPCSGGKNGSAKPADFAPGCFSAALPEYLVDTLAKTRETAFRKAGTIINLSSPQIPALSLYTGNPYKVPGFMTGIRNAIRSGADCLIVSGGYGLVRWDEPIRCYQARMSQTASIWRRVLPQMLQEYVRTKRIRRVFVAVSSIYASVLSNVQWPSSVSEIWWAVPHVPYGEGALVKVPRMVGEAVVQLVGPDQVPGAGWFALRDGRQEAEKVAGVVGDKFESWAADWRRCLCGL